LTPSSGGSARDRDELVERVRAFVADRRLWRPGQRLVVGVSGGADSMCLLDVVRQIARSPRRIHVVHVDHQLRPDSSLDAELVAERSAHSGMTCEVVRHDVAGYAAERRVGLEQAGRISRYRAFARAAVERRAAAVLTGHTLDDSIETVLMHVVRGAGVEGLAGIAPSERLDLARLDASAPGSGPISVRLVRPLLVVRRAETTTYCQRNDVPWRTDPTNENPSFLRNRVRHHLLPVLRTYNPAVDLAIARTANLLRDEEEALRRSVERSWRRLARPVPRGAALDGPGWRRQPLAARRWLLRRAARELGAAGDDLGFDAIERAVAFGMARPRQPLQLPNRLTLRYEDDLLVLEQEERR
jgi:tRNA(Ile)-lysidine synthetase-like protein